MGGDKPIGLVVGLAVTAVLILLPALVVVIYYLFANVYALITGADFASGTMNVGVFLVGLVMTVALLVVVMSVGAVLIGRSLSPKRRDA